MPNPKVSVIVPIYKVEKYLMQCIDSILNQTLKDIEVILVDEGDIDECRAIIDMYEFGLKKDSRIRTIHEKNGGYGASVNKGMAIATGEYISIIESDDFIEPTMYEEMYNYAKKLDADVIKCPYYEYKDATKSRAESKKICHYAKEMLKRCPRNQCFSVLDYPALIGVHASLWSGIYKTSYMREYNIKFIEAKGAGYVDVGFRIATLVNTDKTAWIDKPLYNYRLTSSGSSTNNFNLDVMLRRWEEVHKEFSSKIDIYKRFGSESIYDEYVNTAGYIYTNYPVKKEHIQKMHELFQYIPDEIINDAKKLNKRAKQTLLAIKYNKFNYKLLAKSNWYSCQLSFHRTQTKLHLFRYMKHNIIRIIFRLSGVYVIDICIGKVK